MPDGWATPETLRARLRRRWDDGTLARAWCGDEPWDPVSFRIAGPRPADLGDRVEDVRRWAKGWDTATRRGWRIERASLGGRRAGRTELPARACVDSYDAAWSILDVAGEVALLHGVLERTAATDLADWVRCHPLTAIAVAPLWDRLVATVDWIATSTPYASYLREVAAPGVDTKFVETHRAVLADLLDLRLGERVDATAPRTDLARRYRMRAKPSLARVRLLGGATIEGFSDLTVRVDELARRPLPASTIYVVENELTFLAFPDRDDAAVVFGGGYGAPRLAAVPWLADRDVVYWGDLDTHGFAILDRLRGVLPETRSMLMDRRTLLDNEHAWVREATPTRHPLNRLTAEESLVYRDLAEDLYGPSVRLEQERIPMTAVDTALLGALPDLDVDVARTVGDRDRDRSDR